MADTPEETLQELIDKSTALGAAEACLAGVRSPEGVAYLHTQVITLARVVEATRLQLLARMEAK